ncbi:deoxyribose-phosphate aldolase [Flavobacterium gilvum]|uniref:Deoxyribose-phosphate aldolase n=1 Tax=Flavobacterium gilvum TaxID=1492737 RepID=A0AAC9I2R5_9FLAO|nr:deoxyribose-phosphate aldolase [Flavobacterium gilvum]AOW09169.1 deoxyribose-phosphate aldolase [Flavobacterium gilvum]KFC59232.1 deoxyribose-phosphate aldolase [Flavobacterium gilvum]
MNIKDYLDSTYLKTNVQSGLSESDNIVVAQGFIQEAIDEGFKLIMIRPDRVALAKKMIDAAHSNVLVGTVIDFPDGKSSLEKKLEEALECIQNGADDLDFVCNYEAFKAGEINLVKDEILKATQLGLDSNKTVKWIIEVAALTDLQIAELTALIRDVVISNFDKDSFPSVFVKSSTGFYQTENNLPNGATVPSIKIMLENGAPLPVKAAGGVRTYDEAIQMVNLGVKRIGTSGAKAIANGTASSSQY